MKKIISLLLVLVMLFGIFTPVLAVEYGTEIPVLQSLPFTDVRSGQWYFSYVQAMHAEGVMTGTTATTFLPQGPFTRGQVLATLFRIHHGRAHNASDPRNSGFSDVGTGAWYAPYATWARANNIATGSALGADVNAVRQEIALFIHRYVANLTDLGSGSTANAQWNAFPDRGQIGSAHYGALRWANNNGIVRGITADGVTRIVPLGTATRAEAATMLVRLMDLLPDGPSEADIFEQRVLELVNIERANHGVSPLAWHAGLGAISRAHSEDMVRRGFFAHTCPSGRTPRDRMRAAGIRYSFAAENIAAGQRTPESVVTAWMNSPGHRNNILHPSLRHLGVGFYNFHWTQKFIG